MKRTLTNRFTILNQAGTVKIDIEGTIGYEPWWTEDEIVRTKEKMKAQLKSIAAINPTADIEVDINSYGGDVNHGVSIHDLLAKHPAKVTTNILGHTASAATIIAQAGDVRTISANALFLAHQSQTYAGGTAEDMEQSGRMLRKVNGVIADIYAKRSGKPVDVVTEVMDRNNGQGEWITADEALELGFVDSIVEPMAAAASAAMPEPSRLHAFGLPQIPEDKITKTVNEPKEKPEMKNWFKEFFNMTDEDRKELETALDDAEAAAESVKAEVTAEFTAKVEALEAKNTELETKVTETEAELATAKSAANEAATTNEALTVTNVKLSEEKAEAERKLASVTATGNPKTPDGSADTTTEGGFKAFSDAVTKLVDGGMSHADASIKVQRDQPELFQDMLDEANPKKD